MSYELIIILSIAVLFFVFLTVKEFLGKKVCALCASVAVVWACLLAAYYLGFWTDVALLAILMGGSAVGVMYFAEKKIPEKYHIFRLPFYLTAVVAIVFALGSAIKFDVIIFLGVLWSVFVLIYFFKTKPAVKKFADRIVACCRDF